MLKELHNVSKEVIEEMKFNKNMHMTKEDIYNYNRAIRCYLCNDVFSDEPGCKAVRDHDHRTGEYRGAACQNCNINYYENR